MFDKLKFWNRHKCCFCGYPNSEKHKYIVGANGKLKKIYCCNICFGLQGGQPLKDHRHRHKHKQPKYKYVDNIMLSSRH